MELDKTRHGQQHRTRPLVSGVLTPSDIESAGQRQDRRRNSSERCEWTWSHASGIAGDRDGQQAGPARHVDSAGPRDPSGPASKGAAAFRPFSRPGCSKSKENQAQEVAVKCERTQTRTEGRRELMKYRSGMGGRAMSPRIPCLSRPGTNKVPRSVSMPTWEVGPFGTGRRVCGSSWRSNPPDHHPTR